MKTITLNGKKYKAKAFDFNMICDLEDLGIAMADLGKKPMVTLRAYIALCMNSTLDVAGKEIEKHLAKGGNFEEAINVMSAQMEESDFFRSLAKTEEQAIAEN